MTCDLKTLRCLAAVSALILAGCQTLPTDEQAHPEVSETIETPSIAQPESSQPALSFRELVDLIQDGRYDDASDGLHALLEREPRNRAARHLLTQLEADPVELLGPEYRLHEVQRGETLGELAARHLGDQSLFVALARYNKLERPRLLRAGQSIKLPTRLAPSIEPADAQPLAQPSPSGAAPEPTLDTTSPESTPADSVIDQAQVAEYHEAAIILFRNQQLDEAIALWDQVLAIAPDFAPAQGYRTRALELKRRLGDLEQRP